jgi:uncharacterized protein YfkK (UPF0435 family)
MPQQQIDINQLIKQKQRYSYCNFTFTNNCKIFLDPTLAQEAIKQAAQEIAQAQSSVNQVYNTVQYKLSKRNDFGDYRLIDSKQEYRGLYPNSGIGLYITNVFGEAKLFQPHLFNGGMLCGNLNALYGSYLVFTSLSRLKFSP